MKKREKNLINKIIIFTIVLFLLFLILIFIQSPLIEGIKRIVSSPTKVEIKDECTVILGNLLHQIKNQDDCKIRCNNECELLKLRFHDLKFTESLESCHLCECYCK